MSMFRKYLLKKDFWAQPRRDGKDPTCYIKHDVRCGGIYAYIQHRGVRVVVDNETKEFQNFDDLDQYLDRLHLTHRDDNIEFMQILTRRGYTDTLRKFPF